jgi:hypothetical protein
VVVVFCRLVLFYCFTSALGKKFVSKRSLIISSPPLSLSLSLAAAAAAAAAAVAVAVAALSLNEFDDDDEEDSFTRAQMNTRIVLLTFSLSNTIK